MKKLIQLSILASLFFSITSCTTVSFTPKISLDVSPKTINKTVQVDKFVDYTTSADRKNPAMGVSVTNSEGMINNLDLEVSNALVEDFSSNALFKQVSRKIDNPDYIIRGEIIKFSGKSELNSYAKLSMGIAALSYIAMMSTLDANFIWGFIPFYGLLLGIPSSNNTADIAIILRLYDKNENLVGSYLGEANSKNSSSIYHNKTMSVPSLTNKTFSNAILQIREQILKDIDKIEGR